MLQGLSELQHRFVIVSKEEFTSAALLGRLEKKHRLFKLSYVRSVGTRY